MGWTWGVGAAEALRSQPALANVPELVARWPGLKEAIQRAGLPIPAPPAGGGNAGGNGPQDAPPQG